MDCTKVAHRDVTPVVIDVLGGYRMGTKQVT